MRKGSGLVEIFSLLKQTSFHIYLSTRRLLAGWLPDAIRHPNHDRIFPRRRCRIQINVHLSANDQQIFEDQVQKAHAALGEERFTRAWQKGTRLAQEQTNFATLFAPLPDIAAE